MRVQFLRIGFGIIGAEQAGVHQRLLARRVQLGAGVIFAEFATGSVLHFCALTRVFGLDFFSLVGIKNRDRVRVAIGERNWRGLKLAPVQLPETFGKTRGKIALHFFLNRLIRPLFAFRIAAAHARDVLRPPLGAGLDASRIEGFVPDEQFGCAEHMFEGVTTKLRLNALARARRDVFFASPVACFKFGKGTRIRTDVAPEVVAQFIRVFFGHRDHPRVIVQVKR